MAEGGWSTRRVGPLLPPLLLLLAWPLPWAEEEEASVMMDGGETFDVLLVVSPRPLPPGGELPLSPSASPLLGLVCGGAGDEDDAAAAPFAFFALLAASHSFCSSSSASSRSHSRRSLSRSFSSALCWRAHLSSSLTSVVALNKSAVSGTAISMLQPCRCKTREVYSSVCAGGMLSKKALSSKIGGSLLVFAIREREKNKAKQL